MEAIAETLGTDSKTVGEFRARMQRRDLSLEAPVSEDGDSEIHDFLANDELDQETGLGSREALSTLQSVVEKVREGLEERDLTILEQRILSETPATLDEIGRQYGVSKERIRQLEKRIRQRIVDVGRTHFHETKLLPPPKDS